MIAIVEEVLVPYVAAATATVERETWDDDPLEVLVVTPTLASAARMHISYDYGFVTLQVGPGLHSHEIVIVDGWEDELAAVVTAVVTGNYGHSITSGLLGPSLLMVFATPKGNIRVTHSPAQANQSDVPRRYPAYG